MGWRATWLADEFRKAGLTVVEVEGWKTRGADFPDPPTEEGVSLFHHTASAATSGPAGGLRIVTYGRPGLSGPIANWLTARNGIIYVIAAGVSHNAGTGNARAAGMPHVTGNSNTLANEMENNGRGEPFPAVQRTAALKAHAAVHQRMGWPATRGIGHLEWSTTGKPDPYPPTWGPMSVTRTQLAALIAGTTTTQEDDMFGDDDRSTLKNIQGRTYELYAIKTALAASEARESAMLALLERAVTGTDGDLDLAAVRAIVEAEGEKTRAAQEERDQRLADALDGDNPPPA